MPELKTEINKGHISISKARRITSVLTSENKSYWFNLAKTKSKQVLEKEVARVSPKTQVREKLSYIHPSKEIRDKVVVKKTDGH